MSEPNTSHGEGNRVVRRCICYNLRFEELKQLAQREGLSYEQLSERTGCGTGCGMCEPYVRLVLKTGRTDLPILTTEQVEQILSEAPATAGGPPSMLPPPYTPPESNPKPPHNHG
jgi:bacterioferritin-associated ferredoxin